MIANVKKSLLLLDRRERALILVLTSLRALLGLLDIAGIFFIGLLLAKATNQLTSNSYNNETLDLASSISGDLSLIQIASLALVLFISKSIFASLLMQYMTIRFAKSESKIATLIYLRILHSQISMVSTISKSEIVYALTYSAGFAITQTLTVMVIIFSELFLLIFISGVFAIVDLQLTVYIVLYFAILGTIMHRTIGSQFEKAGKKYASSAVASSATVEDSIATFREIFALEKQSDFELKFAEARFVLAKSMASINFLSGLPRYIVESALMVGAIGLAAITLRTSDPAAAAGTLGIFLTGGLRIMASMLPLQNSLGTLKQMTAQADSFLRLAQTFPDALDSSQSRIDNKSVNMDLEPIAVELDNVSFVYEGADMPAIRDISISISKGSTVAFIGYGTWRSI